MIMGPPELDERVRVYLSSSMATPEHRSLRNELKDFLDTDDLLSVYAIEDLGSGYGANELMVQKVLWSDVVLMLLQDDLRPGVETEYHLAQRNGKRLVILVHSSSRSQELDNFLSYIEQEGCEYFGTYSGLDDLKPLARESLRADVVDVYREVQRQLFTLRNQVKHLIPKPAKGAYSFLTEALATAERSVPSGTAPEEIATRTIMKAFLDGSDYACNDSLGIILQRAPQEYADVVRARWEGIGAALVGNYPLAKRTFGAAKAEASSKCLPKWIIRDIVLDMQYMEICRANQGEASAIERLGSFRQTLQSLAGWDARSPVYYDLHAMGHSFLDETLDAELDGDRTIRLGTNLSNHLDKLSEVLAAAIWLGSFSMMRTIRSLLARVLFHYGFEQDDQKLLIEGVKQLALGANLSRLEKFLKSHAVVIAERANELLLAPGAFPGLDVDLPERWRARCLLLEYFGDYVTDNDLDEVKDFLESCYNFDVANGFHGSVMRQALGALSCIAPRLDPKWLMEKAFPLAGGHPVLADQVEKVLYHATLCMLDEEDLLRISNVLVDRRSQPQLPSRLALLVKLSEVSTACRSKISEAFVEDWSTNPNALSISFFVQANVELDQRLANQMAEWVCESIDAADRSLNASSPIGFGGFSSWQLLSALMEMGAEVDDQRLVPLATQVLCNTNQSSNEKRDCMEMLLWQAKIGRANIPKSVSEHLLAREEEVFSVRGGQLPFFQATRLELELLLMGVHVTAGLRDWHLLTQVLMRGGASKIEDVRLAVVGILRHVEHIEPSEHRITAISLLGTLTRDDSPRVRIEALHGLSERVKLEEEFGDMVADQTSNLSQDEHPNVRMAAAYVAGKWLDKPWAVSSLRQAVRDRNYRVRKIATDLLAADN